MGSKLARQLVYALALAALVATACTAGSYQGVTGIPYAGITSNRGIAVNSVPSSPCYGYVYGIDAASGAVRIWKPDSGGTAATSYSDTKNKLSYATPPASTLMHHVFVGPDGTVWLADYSGKQICTGPPDGAPAGGNLTVQIDSTKLTYKPRSIFVTGSLGVKGCRVYVAETESGTAKKAEVFEWDGTAWNRIADIGDVGLGSVWYVTVDSAGNSYWAANTTSAPFMKKVKPDFSVDDTWTFTKPAFFGASWSMRGAVCVRNAQTGTENLYVSAFNQTSCTRFSMNAEYVDGYGNTSGMASTPPAGTWTSIAFSAPSSGNKLVWLAADDQHNTYLTVIYPSVEQIYKVHLQSAPQPPQALTASNDVYGQIRLAWTPPAASMDDPTGYKVYRGSSPGSETLYATLNDSYPKWKDTAAAGGPYYYTVTSFNGAGESTPSPEAGPVSVTSGTAPAPGSKGVALSYSEINASDTMNNPGYDEDWDAARRFLDDRSVAYDKVWDADSGQLNIENDGIAGYKLLILNMNRNMTAYTAQCIRDYVKFSQGKVLSGYYNSIANHKGVRQSNYALSDVYRADALNIGQGGSPFSMDATGNLYSFLKPVAGAPAANGIFLGLKGGTDLFDGAQEYGSITYLIKAYADGTASEAGKWFNQDGLTQSQADPNDVTLVVGYRDSTKTAVQSVMLGGSWWAQTTANAEMGGAPGTFSANRLMENILGFLGVQTSPATITGDEIGSLKAKDDGKGALLIGKVVSRALTSNGPYYIEDTSRASGIRLKTSQTLSEGLLVTVAGVLETAADTSTFPTDPIKERQVNAVEILAAGQTDVPLPLGIRTGLAGGQTEGSQFGVDQGIGLNNVGLLATVWGRVTEVSAMWFRLDDGSGYQPAGQTYPGIKVAAEQAVMPVLWNVGDYVKATGVIGTELSSLDGQGVVVPVLRMRDQDTGERIKP